MTTRNYGEYTSLNCRHDSHELTDKQRRRREILFVMKDEHGYNRVMTAMEIANELHTHGFVNRLDRNTAAPRLTEMCKDGTVDIVGTKKDEWTGRTVACYRIVERL